ncbi:hypothetical protein FQN52_004153 [Onygenales sp. PD_12]|nr:hypothetical protein FQN52_004153 [Onygenales sp. PD_12]
MDRNNSVGRQAQGPRASPEIPAAATNRSSPLPARRLSRSNTHHGEDSRNELRPSLSKSHTTTSFSRSPAAQASGSLSQLQLKTSNATSPSNHDSQPQTPIDPLSEHILKRTNTEKSLTPRLRPPQSDTEPGGQHVRQKTSQEDATPIARADTNLSQRAAKDKKKAVSFLSRIIGSKKKEASGWKDDVSEAGENRATGMDAEVFAQPIGFIPRFPPPPRYIKVRSHYKKDKEFDRLFIAQELCGRSPRSKSLDDNTPATNNTDSNSTPPTGKAIWALEFSKDGKFLAAAGQDKKVRVWAVIATPEDRQAHEIEEEAQNDQPYIRLSAPVFKSQPVQEYEGHTASVVDLSWSKGPSKNNFLLSTSMDKTVRLWHVTRNECLCCFKHSDFVTSISFHPQDDRFFLAGSLDCKLRLWSIPDKSVAFWATVPDMITSVAFTPDGKQSIAGCLNGLCLIYETDGLKIQSQVHVRSARGRNAKGSKITGIDTIVQPPDDPNGSVKLLITSNDSRIRLYNFRDRNLEAKFRGNENSSSQIRATFSSDGRYIICGSEDRKAYIWPIDSPGKDPEKRAVEIFEAHPSVVTTAIMAPVKTKQLLGGTKDMLYDLCNPPPVNLASQAASVASRPTTATGKSHLEEPSNRIPRSATFPPARTMEGTLSHSSRSAHPGGNIIVAADSNGTIKVFRQDCGYHRRRSETWDTSFSRKILGRTNSVSTRHSVASSFSRDSIHKTPSERILSWRNSVMGTDNPSFDNVRSSVSLTARSTSPSRSLRPNEKLPRGHVPRVSITTAEPSTRSFSPTHLSRKSSINKPFSGPAPSEPNQQTSSLPNHTRNDSNTLKTPSPNPNSDPKPKSTSSRADPLWLGGEFWDKFAAQASKSLRRVDSRDDEGSRKQSAVSTLSSEMTSEADEDEDEDAEELICPRCRGGNFRATRTRGGGQRLICVKCGFPAP